jgi:signal transduction histidine kinase
MKHPLSRIGIVAVGWFVGAILTFALELVNNLVDHGVELGDEVGGQLGFVLLRSLDQETAVLSRIRSDLYAAAAAVAVLALLVALAVSTGITRRVRRIVEAAVEMRRGNYDAPLDVRSGDELGTLAQEFDSMRRSQRHEIERLGEIDRMKSNFIAVASHEIITPITTIGAYADLMADGSLGQVSTPQRNAIDAIHRGVEFLTRLARDLTNMSLIDRGALPVRLGEGDVGRLVAEIGAQVAPLAARRRQRLEVVAEPDLSHPRVDSDYLGQAIMNLVMNAIRFTPDGGEVEIRARRLPASVEIAVRDSGIGISETDRERIFAKMGALRDANSHSSGTIEFNSGGLGLGLSIARGIVEAHEGSIRVESAVGRGTTFTISLPLRRSGGADPQAGEELSLAS